MRLGNLFTIYFRQMKKEWMKSLALVVLFTIAIAMVNMGLYELDKSRYDITVIKQFFQDRENIYNISIWITDVSEVTEEGIYRFTQNLGKLQGVEMAGKYYDVNMELKELRDDEEFLNFNRELKKDTEFENYPSVVDIFYVDRELCSLLGVEQLSKAKHGDILPMLVGASYGDFFKEGDIYTDDMGCRYQICGILPAGFQFPPNGLFQTELPYENMDDKLVTLYDSRLISSSPYITNASQTIYCLTDGSVETEERIESLAKSCFIYIKMDTIDQKIEQYKQEEKWYLQITALFTGITVLAAFLAMISSSIIQIILKKQEYGILYANGVSKWDGIRLIAIKNVILQGVAFLLATLYVAKKIGKETIYYAPQQLSIFYQFTIWKTLLVVLLLSLISTVIPALVLNRLKLVKLLGGNEL